jgi:hypothetical protein
MSEASMVAGRELDALIAEKVFGVCAHKPVRWTREEVIARERAEFLEEYGMEAPPTWVGDADIELSGDYPPYKCAKCGDARVNSRLITKPYSTDIAAAWLVLEKLAVDKWWPELRRLVDWDNVEKWYAACNRRPHVWSATAATAPLAICRAALEAIASES